MIILIIYPFIIINDLYFRKHFTAFYFKLIYQFIINYILYVNTGDLNISKIIF